MESVSQLLGAAGAVSPALGGLGAGMGAGGAFADAASSAWDFGSNAIANIGDAFDPAMIGGPFMPSLGGGGGAAAASGEVGEELHFGLVDPYGMDYGAGADGALDMQYTSDQDMFRY